MYVMALLDIVRGWVFISSGGLLKLVGLFEFGVGRKILLMVILLVLLGFQSCKYGLRHCSLFNRFVDIMNRRESR